MIYIRDDDFHKAANVLRFWCMNTPVTWQSYGFVTHPLTSNPAVMVGIPPDVSFEHFDKDNEERLKKLLFDKFEEDAPNIHTLIWYLNKPYWLTALWLVKDFLSVAEFNESLALMWCTVEFPHQERIEVLLDLFRRSKPELLMEADDLIFFKAIPDEVKVYRGLQGKKARVKGLSWTLDLDKARWFANRFGQHGRVYSAVINREYVFMFDDGMSEKEIVLDPTHLRRLTRLDKQSWIPAKQDMFF